MGQYTYNCTFIIEKRGELFPFQEHHTHKSVWRHPKCLFLQYFEQLKCEIFIICISYLDVSNCKLETNKSIILIGNRNTWKFYGTNTSFGQCCVLNVSSRISNKCYLNWGCLDTSLLIHPIILVIIIKSNGSINKKYFCFSFQIYWYRYLFIKERLNTKNTPVTYLKLLAHKCIGVQKNIKFV